MGAGTGGWPAGLEPRSAKCVRAHGDRLCATASEQLEFDGTGVPPSRANNPAVKHEVAEGLSQYARKSTSAAGLAIELASLLGQPDAAFQFAEALFFSRGFVVPDETGSTGAVAGATLDDRRTRVLFLPSTAAIRTDRRFDRILVELGLQAY